MKKAKPNPISYSKLQSTVVSIIILLSIDLALQQAFTDFLQKCIPVLQESIRGPCLR